MNPDVLEKWREEAKDLAEEYGYRSDDDWGPGFTERVFGERILKLIEIIEIQKEALEWYGSLTINWDKFKEIPDMHMDIGLQARTAQAEVKSILEDSPEPKKDE